MAEPTIQLGGGNWAGKTDNLLGYYKEGERFYKQDFTFSRSTTGTYTDSDGYIQEMPYNKLLQSNTFDTSWSNSGTTETSGQSGYDGTNNAWLLEKSQSNAYIYQNITQSNTQTISVYAKSGSVGGIQILIDDSVNSSQSYNLDNGTLIGTGNGESSSIENVGGGWYRCIFTINDSATRIRFYPATNTGDKTGTSGSIYIQNAQLVKGSSAKTYFPTTTRLNMPRVDYKDNSNGSLILEPQRTNLVTYSSELDNAAWTKSGTTITANNTTSPDGTTNADKIIASSGLSIKIAYQVKSSTNSVAHTVSAFYKADEYSYAFLRVGGQTPSPYVIYNLSNQSVVSTANATSTKIEDYGSGWYRVSMTYTANSATNAPNVSFLPTSGYTLDSSNQPSYNGDGSSGGYVWGAQLEQGNYATTLINTSGSSVTRNADVCTDGGDVSRFNSSEGVLYAEIASLTELGDGTTRLSISDGTQDNNITIGYSATNTLRTIIRSGASNQALMTSSQTITNYLKVAVKYKVNDFALWVNGVEVATDTSGLAPVGLSELSFDRGDAALPFYGKVKDLKYYNTALSDTELATLTT